MTGTEYTREFLRRIPKTDLHLHLDGSLRLSTLIELARQEKIRLPSFTEEGLRDLVFKKSYNNLNEYLAGFAWTTRVMQNPENLERVAYELALDNAAEGVRYIEVRFAPQLHIHHGLCFEDIMHAVDRGFARARSENNRKCADGEPPFEYGIIVTAMRFFTEEFSEYFGNLCRAHRYSEPEEITRMASMELARATVALRRNSDVQIVGFDLAGSEKGYPAADHEPAFQYVHRNFLNKTVHAGEAYGPESIFQAITKLHANRIGHGLHLFNKDAIRDTSVDDRDAYIANLANYIANNRITIEVCLTSNMQTSPGIGEIRNHSVGTMMDKNISITLCTDNRLVSDTTVTNEIALLVENFPVPLKQLKNILVYGFKRSFFYRPYNEKRRYVRQVLDYFDRIASEY
jgi:adenosine deaminase